MVRPRVCAAWLFLLFVVLLLPASAAEFPDVPQWHWAWRYVQGVSDADIATGYWNGDYRPDEVVTRGQMAVFVARAMRGGEAGVPEASGAATFGDVPEGHWARKYVEYAARAGVAQGYPDGLYHPDEPVTRGQMAVFVTRAMREGAAPPAHSGPPTFSDVTAAGEWAWCSDYVEYAAAEGVVTGYPDGQYHPEREVTRDQMAVYLCRAFDLPLPDPTYNITEHFPLGAGDTWTYDSSEGFHTATVDGTITVAGTECRRLTSSLGDSLYWAAAADGLRQGGGDDGSVAVTFDPLLLIPNGLQVGDSGTMASSASIGGASAGGVTFTYTFLELATVTVGAGTFTDCMKVELEIAATGDLAEHYVVWLARGVGIVKLDSRPFGGTEWAELVLATVGGTAHPASRGSYLTANYQPLAMATQRIYDSTFGMLTEEIVGVEVIDGEEAYRLDLGPTYGDWSDPHRSYYRMTSGAVALVAHYDSTLGLGTYTPPIGFPAMVQLGDQGTIATAFTAGGTITWEWAMVGVETVTVPAGRFRDCLKFHTKATDSAMSGGEQLEWYAPGVGLVKADTRPFGGEWWQEATSAHAGGVSYPITGGLYDISDYFDLSVGNQWVLASEGEPSQTLWQVLWTENEGGHEWASVGIPGADTTTFSLRTDDAGLYYLGYSGGFTGTIIRFSPPIHVPNGLFPGDSERRTVTVTEHGVSIGEAEFRCAFPGIEAVSTPAGVFPDCMRLEYELRMPAGVTETAVAWLARGVGMVKQERTIEPYQWSLELGSAKIGEVSYPPDPARTYDVTDYWPLAADNAWMVRTGGEWLSAQRTIVDGTQDVSGLGITDTVYRVSSYGEEGFAGAQLWAARADGLARYGFVKPGAPVTVVDPPLLIPDGALVGTGGTGSSTVWVWTGESWSDAGTAEVSTKIVAAGPVTTEAGTFPDCLLVRQHLLTAATELTEYFWLAKGVGPVRCYVVGEPAWSSLMGATVGGVRVPDVPAPPAITSLTLTASATEGADLSAGAMTSDSDLIDLRYEVLTTPGPQGVLQCSTESGLSYVIGLGEDPFLAYREFGTWLPWDYAVWGAGWSTESMIWNSYWSGAGSSMVVATREGGYALVRITAIGEGSVDLEVSYPYGGQ